MGSRWAARAGAAKDVGLEGVGVEAVLGDGR